jgi:prepilin-type N-terminal cleavage/methylation domain-containing protein
MSRTGTHSRPDERGFTLLELLVAMVILGLTLALVGSGGRLLRDTGERLADRRDSMADLAILTTLLHERLGDAVALDFGRAGRTEASFLGTDEEARFLTLGRTIEPGGPLVLMAVGEREGGGIEVLRAEIDATESGFDALDDSGRAEARALAMPISDVDIAYFGRKEGDRAAGWHAAWQEEALLPLAVRLDLEQAGRALPPIIVPVRQTLASLCATPGAPPECVRE